MPSWIYIILFYLFIHFWLKSFTIYHKNVQKKFQKLLKSCENVTKYNENITKKLQKLLESCENVTKCYENVTKML